MTLDTDDQFVNFKARDEWSLHLWSVKHTAFKSEMYIYEIHQWSPGFCVLDFLNTLFCWMSFSLTCCCESSCSSLKLRPHTHDTNMENMKEAPLFKKQSWALYCLMLQALTWRGIQKHPVRKNHQTFSVLVLMKIEKNVFTQKYKKSLNRSNHTISLIKY